MKLGLFVPSTFLAFSLAGLATAQESWRYYRPSNTGIQGDYCDALWIGPDGDPWIGGYVPSFEEGGIAKLVQAENRWVNVSNVDYPVIGHPDLTGTARVADIVADADGNLWMGTGRGALKFDPEVGPASLVNYNVGNSGITGGWTTGVELAPDGTIWFSAYGTVWGAGGLRRFDPAANAWTPFPGYGDGELAVQPRPGGGYYVWATRTTTGQIARYDSTTGAWTSFAQVTDDPWGLPGKACTDAAGNTWMFRLTGPSNALQRLDCRRPDGTWIGTPVPPLPNVIPPIWAFRAFGDRQALLVDGNSRTWRFDGATWQGLGIWRQGAYTQDVDIDAAGNVWVCGTGGAAKRDSETGEWQRYRVTNTSQYDFFLRDIALDDDGSLWMTGNAGPGYGGMQHFDGVRWFGYNAASYGLGGPWPFPTDNSDAITARMNREGATVNPMFNGVHDWDGAQYLDLQGLSETEGLVQDSLGRIWAVGTYFNLRVHDGNQWSSVPIAGWGANVVRDPDAPGMVWACANLEVVRTDGTYRFGRQNVDFPELNPQHDVLTTVAAAPGGIAWVGSTEGLFRVDSNTGQHTWYHPTNSAIPGDLLTPLAVSPDGRVWFTNFGSAWPVRGLCWFDGTNFGIHTAPLDGGPQWGGLPHAQIADMEVRPIPGGYELWMSCLSRGVAVLTRLTEDAGTPFCLGDGSAVDCPCGPTQNGAPGEGCLNSFGTGATLAGTGSTSVSTDTLRLDAAGLPPSTTVLFFQYDVGAAPVLFGDGLSCAGGPVVRMRAAVASGGQASIGSGLTAPISVLGGVPAGGGLRHYQGWYRNQQAFCTPAAFNTTGGLSVDWQP